MEPWQFLQKQSLPYSAKIRYAEFRAKEHRLHSFYYIAVCLRLKAEVEDRNYPPPYAGRGKIMSFCRDVLFHKEMTIDEICKKHQVDLPIGRVK